MTLWAVCRDSHPRAITHEFTDQSAAGVGLAGARGTLNRQNAEVLLPHNAESGVQSRFVVSADRFTVKTRRLPWSSRLRATR